MEALHPSLQPQAPILPQAPIEHKTDVKFALIVALIAIIALGAALYYAYTGFQNLREQREISRRIQETQAQLAANIQQQQKASPLGETLGTTTTAEIPESWQTYTSQQGNFSVRIPAEWRALEVNGWVGFGPAEVGGDALYGVSMYSSAVKGYQEILQSIGTQFPDIRRQTERITVSDMPATLITATSPSNPEWYSLTVVVDAGEMLYAIGNSAQSDEALNQMLQQRVPSADPVSFVYFYSSFSLD